MRKFTSFLMWASILVFVQPTWAASGTISFSPEKKTWWDKIGLTYETDNFSISRRLSKNEREILQTGRDEYETWIRGRSEVITFEHVFKLKEGAAGESLSNIEIKVISGDTSSLKVKVDPFSQKLSSTSNASYKICLTNNSEKSQDVIVSFREKIGGLQVKTTTLTIHAKPPIWKRIENGAKVIWPFVVAAVGWAVKK